MNLPTACKKSLKYHEQWFQGYLPQRFPLLPQNRSISKFSENRNSTDCGYNLSVPKAKSLFRQFHEVAVQPLQIYLLALKHLVLFGLLAKVYFFQPCDLYAFEFQVVLQNGSFHLY